MATARGHARTTRQLQTVWDTVKDDKSHPTADQIYERVRKKLPSISLGTVYRNLQKLVAEKKLQVLMRGRSQHFDPLVERHQHFNDLGEQRVVLAKADVQPGLEAAAALADEDRPTGHDVAVVALDPEPLRVGIAPVS